jgi:hypothetical protein
MMRTSVTKLARPARPLSRMLSTTARVMSAGDTGAPPKTGGLGYVAGTLSVPLGCHVNSPLRISGGHELCWRHPGVLFGRAGQSFQSSNSFLVKLFDPPLASSRNHYPANENTFPQKAAHQSLTRAQVLTFSLSSDAFQRRERAQEDYAIRQREKEKLKELRKKIQEQQAHLQQLADHMYVHENTNTNQTSARP